MTDLTEIRQEIASLDLATPPVNVIVERAGFARRRRNRRRTGSLAVAFALVIAVAVVVVSLPARKSPVPLHRGPVSTDVTPYVYAVDEARDAIAVFKLSADGRLSKVKSIGLPFAPGLVVPRAGDRFLYVAPIAPESQAGSKSVYEVDLATGKIVRKVSGPEPLGNVTASPNADTAYAYDNDIIPINFSTGAIGRSFAPSDGYYNDLAISPDGKTAVATCLGPAGGIRIIDLLTHRVTKTIKLTMDSTVDGVRGFWVAMNVSFESNGTTALVSVQRELSNNFFRAQLFVLDVRTGKVRSIVDLAAGGVGNVVVANDNRRAYVFVQDRSPGEFEVVPVELATDRALAPINVGATDGVLIAGVPGHDQLLTVDVEWNAAIIDQSLDRVVARFHIPVSPANAVTLQPISVGAASLGETSG
ncbi:MAG: hypothetical protein WAM97_15650 [Acidimicrobiales bacterium]